MPKSERQQAYDYEWDKANTRFIGLKLNVRTDADILAAIDAEPGDSMQGKVKAIIRRAINDRKE